MPIARRGLITIKSKLIDLAGISAAMCLVCGLLNGVRSNYTLIGSVLFVIFIINQPRNKV